MSKLSVATEETLRKFFKTFNQFMLLMWRLGLGQMLNWSPDIGGRIMVVTQIGRKTGTRRQTPVNYALIDGDIYCVAGFGRGSDWYRNIIGNPKVEVWLPDSWWNGIAEDITGQEGYLDIVRQVLIASGFAAILAGINPRLATPEQLATQVESYRLVRIRRTEARTGPGGPGEFSWIWPLMSMVLLPLVFCRRKRR